MREAKYLQSEHLHLIRSAVPLWESTKFCAAPAKYRKQNHSIHPIYQLKKVCSVLAQIIQIGGVKVKENNEKEKTERYLGREETVNLSFY